MTRDELATMLASHKLHCRVCRVDVDCRDAAELRARMHATPPARRPGTKPDPPHPRGLSATVILWLILGVILYSAGPCGPDAQRFRPPDPPATTTQH